MGRLTDARRRARHDSPEPVPAERSVEETPEALPVPAAATAASAGPSETPATLPEAGPEDHTAAPAGPAPGPVEGGVPPVPVPVQDAEAPSPGGVGDDLVFPDDDAPLPARIVLPPSGLASDILASVGLGRMEASAAEPPDALDAVVTPAARAHQFSFFATPEHETREQSEANEHLVTFIVGEEEYGVDVHIVQEIIRVPAVTAVPRAPAFVRGVINLRGRIIPVIDLKTKLGLGRVETAERRARVVVVCLKSRLVGLLVDGASQVLKVPVSVIEAAPQDVVEIESHFLRGVAKLDGRLIILVDLLEVLAPELRAEGTAR